MHGGRRMVVPRRERRLAQWGWWLISGSAVASATRPWLADWNRSHTFGPEYGSHPRWHGTSEVLGATPEGLLALGLLRTGHPGRRPDERLVTAVGLLPIARWAPFSLTLVVPEPFPTTSTGSRSGYPGAGCPC